LRSHVASADPRVDRLAPLSGEEPQTARITPDHPRSVGGFPGDVGPTRFAGLANLPDDGKLVGVDGSCDPLEAPIAKGRAGLSNPASLRQQTLFFRFEIRAIRSTTAATELEVTDEHDHDGRRHVDLL